MPEGEKRREEIDANLFENDLSVSDETLKDLVVETLSRLPEDDLDHLLFERVIRVIQPLVNTVVELNDLNLSLKDPSGRIMLVVFETGLTKRPHDEAVYVIAHEFAHVFLGHATNQINVDEDCELEADRQVIKWGFEEELRSAPFNYLYGGKAGRK